jgi:hypothetical protein
MILKSSPLAADIEHVRFATLWPSRRTGRGSWFGKHDENVMQIADYTEEMPASRGCRRKTFRLSSLTMAILLSGCPWGAVAQQTKGALASERALPDAPGMETPVEAPVHRSAAISGTVLDTNGGVVAGARVLLTGTVERVAQSGSNGEFAFSDLPPGTFRLTVTQAGMETFVSSQIRLHEGDMRLVTKIVLPVAATAIDVKVEGDREELAQEEVHAAVGQRVFGVFPNFYSAYDWNAPPLGAKQKFHLAFRSVTDPMSFLGAGIRAGLEQESGTFPQYGQGVQGFAKRYGAAYADDAIGRMVGSAVLPSLFHQDPRYFYKGSGSVVSRALYAISASFVCRGDNGRQEPCYSPVLGSFTAGAISNLYYPPASRGVHLIVFNGLIETVGGIGNNLFKEFFLRGITSHVPAYENGKP